MVAVVVVVEEGVVVVDEEAVGAFHPHVEGGTALHALRPGSTKVSTAH